MNSLGKEQERRRKRFIRIFLLASIPIVAVGVGWFVVAAEGKPLTWLLVIQVTASALVAVGGTWWTMIAHEKFQKNMEEKDRRAALNRERERAARRSDPDSADPRASDHADSV